MITPAEIKKKALRQYPRYLSAEVLGSSFFPLEVRFGTRVPKGDFHDFDQMRSQLLKAAKSTQRSGYSVELRPQAMRRYGEQLIPARVFFETETDYLAGIDKQKEAEEFKALLAAFRERLPASLSLLAQKPQLFLPHLAEYNDLIEVCLYFKDHPRPGCYIRELPIQVHTKFVETHTKILRPLLEAVLPQEAIDAGASRFTLRFGLKDAEPLMRFRLLSGRAQELVPVTFQEIALPVSDFETIDFQGQKVVIIENLMTYLTWPATSGDVAVFGKGFQAGALERNRSLGNADLIYWGDLDAQGFMILAQIRSKFPHARSFLMDQQTYDAHRQFVVDGNPCPAEALPGLTEDEVILFDKLRKENRRLEQEHIPLRYVLERFGKEL